MKYYLSVLYDKELKEYQCPLCFSNEVMVKRYYENLLSRYLTSRDTYKSPELDYIVNHIDNFVVSRVGEFETETGAVSGYDAPKTLFELSIFQGVRVDLKKKNELDKKELEK